MPESHAAANKKPEAIMKLWISVVPEMAVTRSARGCGLSAYSFQKGKGVAKNMTQCMTTTRKRHLVFNIAMWG